MIRPELVAKFRPWAEFSAALLSVLFGLWVVSFGGWFFWPTGSAVAAVSLVWARDAYRRMQFRRQVNAPGLVEVDEGAIRYLSPDRVLGGEVAVRDLREIRLMRLNGHPHWRLKTQSGEALLIPLEAAGAPLLADAFAALPGLDMGQLTRMLKEDRLAIQTVWTRPDLSRLT